MYWETGGRGEDGGSGSERPPHDGAYDRYDRSHDVGGGEREGGRGSVGYERHNGEFDGAPRGTSSGVVIKMPVLFCMPTLVS